MHEEKKSHKFKYFIQLITKKSQQARKFIELYLEIWILSKPCQTIQCRKIFKMKLKCIVNVGEVVAWILACVGLLVVKNILLSCVRFSEAHSEKSLHFYM